MRVAERVLDPVQLANAHKQFLRWRCAYLASGRLLNSFLFGTGRRVDASLNLFKAAHHYCMLLLHRIKLQPELLVFRKLARVLIVHLVQFLRHLLVLALHPRNLFPPLVALFVLFALQDLTL